VRRIDIRWLVKGHICAFWACANTSLCPTRASHHGSSRNGTPLATKHALTAPFALQVHTLAAYLLELGSLVYDTLSRRRSVLAVSALLLALADPGLQEAVSELLAIPLHDIVAHAEHIIGSLQQYVGPGVALAEVTVTTSELLRLHKLAQQPENREQFVVVKFSGAKHSSIASVARPLDTVDDFQRIVRLYYGC
jgi:Cyclin, C-terminal domain